MSFVFFCSSLSFSFPVFSIESYFFNLLSFTVLIAGAAAFSYSLLPSLCIPSSDPLPLPSLVPVYRQCHSGPVPVSLFLISVLGNAHLPFSTCSLSHFHLAHLSFINPIHLHFSICSPSLLHPANPPIFTLLTFPSPSCSFSFLHMLTFLCPSY